MDPRPRDTPRPVGLTKGAGWEIGASKTIDADADTVWRFLTSERGLALWVGPGATLGRQRGDSYRTEDGITGELRSYRDRDRIRLTWHPDGWDAPSTVQLAVVAKAGRTSVRFHQERLTGGAVREAMRTRWKSILDHIASELESDDD